MAIWRLGVEVATAAAVVVAVHVMFQKDLIQVRLVRSRPRLAAPPPPPPLFHRAQIATALLLAVPPTYFSTKADGTQKHGCSMRASSASFWIPIAKNMVGKVLRTIFSRPWRPSRWNIIETNLLSCQRS